MADAEKVPDFWDQAQAWVYQTFGLQGLAVIALASLLLLAWWKWDAVRKLPGVAPLLTRLARRPVPKADPHRFSVMVARIAGDADDALGDQIFEVLKEFEGIQALPLDRTLSGDGRMGEAEQSAGAAAARKYLDQSGASVLIWGKMLVRDEKIARLFLTTSSTAQDTAGRQVSPEIGSTVSLPDVFWEDLAKVLRLAIATRYGTFEAGNYVADRLPSFIAAVGRLLEASGGRPGWDADARGETLVWLGIAQATLGEQTGRDEPLQQAVASYRAALEERRRERVPLDWAVTQNNLGSALMTLGQREKGTARLEQAVTAFRSALQERTRERAPLDWAMTQNNLGIALRNLGQRDSDTEWLEQAVTAFRAALQERTRERVPLQWAATQNNLGTALGTIGERESGTVRLEQAVTAFRAALQERTRERVPLDWAATQDNLGNALRALGEREGGTARLEQAVVAYRAALEERTRERVPLKWAATQNNLGNALATLGERESGTARLELAVVAYRAALEERTRERVPLDWAATQINLGIALATLGERESGTARLEQAAAAYRGVLAVFEAAGASYYVGAARGNLELAQTVLAERLEAPATATAARK